MAWFSAKHVRDAGRPQTCTSSIDTLTLEQTPPQQIEDTDHGVLEDAIGVARQTDLFSPELCVEGAGVPPAGMLQLSYTRGGDTRPRCGSISTGHKDVHFEHGGPENAVVQILTAETKAGGLPGHQALLWISMAPKAINKGDHRPLWRLALN